MSNDSTIVLSRGDKEKIAGFDDVIRPEPEQVLPLGITLLPEEKKEPAAKRLAQTRTKAQEVITKIDELKEKVDLRCSHLKISDPSEIGSPLFQAMVRVFGERTTTITYEHYKRALAKREELAKEDRERLKKQ